MRPPVEFKVTAETYIGDSDMTPKERLDAVAEILATGVLKLLEEQRSLRSMPTCPDRL